MAGSVGNGSCEIDPLIAKGFRLLMSKREESVVELRQLFEEAAAQRVAATKNKGDLHRVGVSVSGGGLVKPYQTAVVKPSSASGVGVSAASSSVATTVTVTAKGEASKRSLDKVGSGGSEASKRIKLDETASAKTSNKVKVPQISPNNDGEEFAIDYVLDKLVGLACEVCKKAEPTHMLECSACRKTYHQDCHQPNAAGREAYDPRNVWFCSKCKPHAPTNPGAPGAKAKQSSSSLSAAPSKAASRLPGDRDKLKSSSSSSSSKDKKSSGSDSSGKSGKSGHFPNSSSSSSSSASSSHPKSSLMDAQKRMENMKKKAAEKRKISVI